jgi:hypothetical protein
MNRGPSLHSFLVGGKRAPLACRSTRAIGFACYQISKERRVRRHFNLTYKEGELARIPGLVEVSSDSDEGLACRSSGLGKVDDRAQLFVPRSRIPYKV